MRLCHIEQKQESKGRQFSAYWLGGIIANSLWDGGSNASDTMERPVYCSFAGSDQELRAFTANILSGRRVIFDQTGYSRAKTAGVEIMKSGGYKTAWQREPEGSIVTFYLPQLFTLDPGMVDPETIRFIVQPSNQWLGSQTLDPNPTIRHLSRMGFPQSPEWITEWLPIACLWASYLDRRTARPLIMEPRFYMQLLLRMLLDGGCSFGDDPTQYMRSETFGVHRHHRYWYSDIPNIHAGISTKTDHQSFEEILAEEVVRFFEFV